MPLDKVFFNVEAKKSTYEPKSDKHRVKTLGKKGKKGMCQLSRSQREETARTS